MMRRTLCLRKKHAPCVFQNEFAKVYVKILRRRPGTGTPTPISLYFGAFFIVQPRNFGVFLLGEICNEQVVEATSVSQAVPRPAEP